MQKEQNDRRIAEQKLCNFLYRKGVVGEDDDVIVRKLDFGEPYSLLLAEKGSNTRVNIGYVDYFPNINRFKNVRFLKHSRSRNHKPFKPKQKRDKTTILDVLKQNGRVSFMG